MQPLVRKNFLLFASIVLNIILIAYVFLNQKYDIFGVRDRCGKYVADDPGEGLVIPVKEGMH